MPKGRAFIFLLLAAGVALYSVIWNGCTKTVSFPPSERYRHLSRLGDALVAYQARAGHLPHDNKGADYALYELRNTLPASAFDIPGCPRSSGTAKYDHTEKRVVGCSYHYINRPLRTTALKLEEAVCVMVERSDIADGDGVYALFSSGVVLGVPSASMQDSSELLGKPVEEVWALQHRRHGATE